MKYEFLVSACLCGVKCHNDGTFTHTLIDGMGLTAQLLAKNGITVISSDDFN